MSTRRRAAAPPLVTLIIQTAVKCIKSHSKKYNIWYEEVKKWQQGNTKKETRKQRWRRGTNGNTSYNSDGKNVKKHAVSHVLLRQRFTKNLKCKFCANSCSWRSLWCLYTIFYCSLLFLAFFRTSKLVKSYCISNNTTIQSLLFLNCVSFETFLHLVFYHRLFCCVQIDI